MLTVHKPHIEEMAPVYVFASLMRNNIPAAVSRTAILWRSLPPVKIAESNPAQQIEAKLLKANGC